MTRTDDFRPGSWAIPECLQTERLLLRRYRASDAQQVSDAIEESRASLERWTPEIATRRSAAEVAAGLDSLAVAWRAGRKFVYAVLDRSTRQFMGEVGLYTIDWQTRSATIGLWLRSAARGQDFGREGFVALATHAQQSLGLQTLDAHIQPANERSRHLAERAGFSLCGAMPGHPARDATDNLMLVYRLQVA